MKTVVVSVTNDLSTDQRVHKTCISLMKFGYNVTLIGRKLPRSVPLNRSYRTIRMKLFFKSGFLFYFEYSIRLFFKLLFIKKDILLSNDLDTLTPNMMINVLFGTEIIYDSHELFTEVPELINRKFVQKTWLFIEKICFKRIVKCYTVSKSIALYYNTKYKTKFQVIHNYPVRIKNPIKTENTNFKTDKKIIIYQGAINLGRGLELMLHTMQHIDNAILVIIGQGDIFLKIKNKIKDLNLNNKVMLLGIKTPQELSTITPFADLGISLEEDMGLSYRYALPNKVFDYLNANVPILVSDLPEIKAIIEKYSVGKIVTNRDPKNIAVQINSILKLPKDNWLSEIEKAKSEYCWENEEKKLKKLLLTFD